MLLKIINCLLCVCDEINAFCTDRVLNIKNIERQHRAGNRAAAAAAAEVNFYAQSLLGDG